MGTIKDTVRKLEREMTGLRLKIHEKEIALKVTWDSRHRKSVELYSKAHLQDWSAALYAKLPRELRDMIYTLSLNNDWDDQMLVDSLTVLYGFGRPQVWNHDQLREYVLLDRSFVKREVAIEVAEMIYRRAEVPSFGMNRREGKPRVLHLKEFLKRDFFGLGVLPAAHIRRLELKLLKNKLSTRNQDALRENLKALTLCAHNRHLRIDVTFPRGNSAIDVLFFLNILSSTYKALASPNITFDITYKRRVHEADPPDADSDETRELNLTHMLELPQGMWKDHMMALCECVGKLSAKEQRWRGYRALRREKDVWADMETEGDTLAIRDPHGRDVWGQCGEIGCTPFWGESWDQEHWLGDRCEEVGEDGIEDYSREGA
ncbi:hypothetical protein DPSP01_012518 [Paraphaeosphaeria sporulosa]|uniref:Uncharacterized protein n=1 Tax=Paraphaeosphaeria sporulosa TaxID=1460663 RepID=A0A177BXF8_9PLEO|nr:uncharacterized protein CC84DRAFT_394008 [Paraphaeosphaeria sporulosa]OAF99378.1 hypothetical protein CC84DRAFT_394008 [Paraphaeosphaeria sporulosa]